VSTQKKERKKEHIFFFFCKQFRIHRLKEKSRKEIEKQHH